MQLVFEFVEADDSSTPMTDIWEALEPQQRAVVVATLARLMAKAIEPEEENDE